MTFKRYNLRIMCVWKEQDERYLRIKPNLLNVDLLVVVNELTYLNRSQNPQEKKGGLDMITVTCPSSCCSFDTLRVYS
jgi:hypothetical protein